MTDNEDHPRGKVDYTLRNRYMQRYVQESVKPRGHAIYFPGNETFASYAEIFHSVDEIKNSIGQIKHIAFHMFPSGRLPQAIILQTK